MTAFVLPARAGEILTRHSNSVQAQTADAIGMLKARTGCRKT